MNLDKWKSQIVRGTLEYCILLMLKRKPVMDMKFYKN